MRLGTIAEARTGDSQPDESNDNGDSLRTASWDTVRGLFAMEPGAVHLNTGTIGVMPYEVLDENDRVTRDWNGGIRNVYPPGMYPEHRATIGRAFGVDQDEMVICHNATEGVARVINGLDLHEGDEVVTTSHECYSVLSNFNLVRNRHRIKVIVLTPPVRPDVTADEIVDMFEQAITPRTRVLAFAAVTLFTGTRMPVRRLCDLAQRHGLVTVVDGALVPGMFDTDLRATGADFITCSGSKFQCGPLGTGLLYVRNKVHPEHNPLPLPTFWPMISTWYPMIGSPPPRTTTRVESYNMGDYLQSAGSASIARGAALAKACELWDRIGRERIERHIVALGDHTRARVAERFGAGAVYSPMSDRSLTAPIVAFNPFPGPADAWNVKKFARLADELEKRHRIWIRWTEFDLAGSPHQHYAARICTHLYNTTDEVDFAVDAIGSLAEEMS